ncbi:MAG: hypothetical protein R6U63_06155 [Longimicrobiales bacterium]
MKNRLSALVIAVLTALAAVPAARPLAAQAPPPDAEWRAFETEHFRITFLPELEPVAREAAAVAERVHAVLSAELTEPPATMIDLLVTDHADYSNGFASSFPSPRVTLYARPAATGEFFARSWIELLVAHELVHIFHLDRSGAVGEAVRAVFGRIPLLWPVFGVVSTPAWSTEGLATHYETRLTGAGRVRASIHDMIIRTAALEGSFPALDELSAPIPVWPAGSRRYVYGGRFMRHIADTYGPDAHGALIDATAGSLWPTFLRFDHVAERAIGKPFDRLYAEWRDVVVDRAEAVAGRVRAAGVTGSRPVAGRGPYAVAPRVSPDGDRLTFAADDWRSDPATRLVDLGTGRTRRLAERNQFGMILDPASWLPDGSGVVVAQLEFQGPYRLFSDLWRVGTDGRETRLTHGLRLAQPDVAGDGRRVAAVQDHRAGVRLVVHDLESGETRVVVDAAPGRSFDRPRWSPDGRRIAAGRHVDGRTDLVVVDATTGEVTRVTDDTALDMAPAWSPDGRWLLWWSDRTGIPNIMAAAVDGGRPAGPVRQVTNVVNGVIDPEVSPDGETLYLAAYHAHGWQIESTAFDPSAWRDAPPPMDRYEDAVLPEPRGVRPAGADGSVGTAGTAGAADIDEAAGGTAIADLDAAPYSPWATLRPYHWVPTWQELGEGPDGRLRFIGASVGGTDLVGRHQWSLELAGDIDTGRLQGAGFWVYRGLGTPELFAGADREYLAAGSTHDVREPAFLREDELVIGALFRRPRWRNSAALQVSAELEHREYEGRERSRAQLEAAGDTLPGPTTLGGLSVSPTFGTARRYPVSISPENGVNVGIGVGRWWSTRSGAHAYDQLNGALAGYLSAPLWGFASHVLAVRGGGFLRDGDLAPARFIGGPGAADLLVALDAGTSYPIRGFSAGDRWGTRGWAANAEWRFPIHLRHGPGRLFGFTLVAVSGALFADAGDAWCTPADRIRQGNGCFTTGAPPLVSAGAELKLHLGIFHNSRARLAMGVAQRLQGGDGVRFYLGTGF